METDTVTILRSEYERLKKLEKVEPERKEENDQEHDAQVWHGQCPINVFEAGECTDWRVNSGCKRFLEAELYEEDAQEREECGELQGSCKGGPTDDGKELFPSVAVGERAEDGRAEELGNRICCD